MERPDHRYDQLPDQILRQVLHVGGEKGIGQRHRHLKDYQQIKEKLFIDDLIYVDKQYMKNNPAKLIRANDIIMSSANSRELVGKTCYINELPFPMTFGGFVLNIRAKDIISEYLFYFLRHEFLFDNFKRLAAQTVNIANINTTKLSNYFTS